jgi:flagellar hook-basal body complex protein FliE
MKPITGIQPPPRPLSPLADRLGASANAEPSSGMDAFAGVLAKQVRDVNTMQVDANDMVHSLLTGGDVNEAEVLTAVQKADLAFRMLLQVRNKLIEAYREVQQIQI